MSTENDPSHPYAGVWPPVPQQRTGAGDEEAVRRDTAGQPYTPPAYGGPNPYPAEAYGAEPERGPRHARPAAPGARPHYGPDRPRPVDPYSEHTGSGAVYGTGHYPAHRPGHTGSNAHLATGGYATGQAAPGHHREAPAPAPAYGWDDSGSWSGSSQSYPATRPGYRGEHSGASGFDRPLVGDRPHLPRPRAAAPTITRPGHAAPQPAPRRRKRATGWWIALIVVAVVTVGAGLRFIPGAPLAPAGTSGDQSGNTIAAARAPSPKSDAPHTSEPALTPLPFRSTNVSLKTTGFWSWALLDRRTGAIVGSRNYASTSTTASMIKAWLAADYLRRAAEHGETPSSSRLHTIEIMIRDSDNNAAGTIYNADGRTASINRLIKMCKLTDSRATRGEWSRTYVSARDTVRMGDCIADGVAAGKKWTPWLLNMMRKVRGVGDFGIRAALPEPAAAEVAIKNGWLLRDEDLKWHVSCMAIGGTWVMSVLQRYPSTGDWNGDFAHARSVCKQVAAQLLAAATR
ncbi:serine hydrolase [Luedemannella helvata]|uniref:Beta-lactamase class A catalytic domain-containing protein n=1 Tax=Luedemannella helvata TaxID=349315 RepID=A0ABP4VSK9_9ACTN